VTDVHVAEVHDCFSIAELLMYARMAHAVQNLTISYKPSKTFQNNHRCKTFQSTNAFTFSCCKVNVVLYGGSCSLPLRASRRCALQSAHCALQSAHCVSQSAHCALQSACSDWRRYEAIGLAPHGKGASVTKDGVSHIDGKLPVNTGGGLMSFGHPVGATGVKQLHEIYRQMKGQCGAYQLKKTPEIGLTVNMGGDDKTIVAMMLKNV